MKALVNKLISIIILLSSVIGSADARDSRFTRKGTGPQYWIAYEYCYDFNIPISEQRWKDNIDWMSENFKEYGYDMISNDGWIEAAQTINKNGYITKYNSSWQHGFEYWNKYIHDKGMQVGIYYNPMWMTRTAYEKNCKVKGTKYTTQEIAGDKWFNSELYWVDVDKPGAEEWVKGYVKYFKDLGAIFLRVDFLENYERNYGTERYEKALRWIMEEAGEDMLISLVMPNCYNHAKTELPYGDMIRIDNDCFKGGWDFASARGRGKKRDYWPQYDNAFDGFIAFSDIAAKGQMIMDGDFMRLNTMANDAEREFLFSLMVIAGSPLCIADQYDTIGDAAYVYQNEEMIELNKVGFIGKPLSRDINDINSSRWVGQMPDGDFIVGLFNREDEAMTYEIDFVRELGIEGGTVKNVRDLWEHKDLGGMKCKYEATIDPHSCKIIRITPEGSIRYQAELSSMTNGVIDSN